MATVDDNVEELIQGSETALPGFHLEQVKQFLLVLQDQVMVAQENRLALRHAQLCPGRLGGTGMLYGHLNIFRRADRDGPQGLTGKGRPDGCQIMGSISV
jgi:hypothetical protein